MKLTLLYIYNNNVYSLCVRRKPDGKGFPRWVFPVPKNLDGQTCGSLSPETGGISQPQRAAGDRSPSQTEKHTGSGIEPGFPDCEATVLPRRHCTPLTLNHIRLRPIVK